MKILVKIIFGLLALIMAISITLSFVYGDFLAEGKELINMPWGIMSLIDIYISFLVIIIWVIYREKNIFKIVFISIGIIVLGSFTIAAYILLLLIQHKGINKEFFMGKHAY